MSSSDIEAIERATVDAVSPEGVAELPGWLLAFDRGTIGRAKSAVPLHHDTPNTSLIAAIEARYAARGSPAWFRLPDVAAYQPMRDMLRARGYAPGKVSLVQIAPTQSVRAHVERPEVTIARAPDEAWGAVLVGEGFDPVDGASRVRAMSRARDAVYASIREGDEAIAAGVAAFGYRWASIHAMRTAQVRRREGLAGRVLSALAEVALERGLERMFLQVEEDNSGALSLYRRAGFVTAWHYDYWTR